MNETLPDADESQPAEDTWFDSTWTKVHPLSPLVRGWLTVIAIPAVLFTSNWEAMVSMGQQVISGEFTADVGRDPLPYVLGTLAVLGVVLMIFGAFVLGWWFTRFKITQEHVMVKSGVLIRQHRQARLDRVQAVDLRQPLLARLTGLAELRFEVADGTGTAVSLAFLRKNDAENMRTEIMDRAAGKHAASADDAIAAEPGQAEHGHAAGHGAAADFREPAGFEQIPHAGQAVEPGLSSETQETVGSVAKGSEPGLRHSHVPPDGAAWTTERAIFRLPVPRLVGSIVLGPLVSIVIALAVILAINVVIAFIVMLTSDPNSLSEALREMTEALSFFFSVAVLVPLLVPMALVLYQRFSSGWKFTAVMTEAGLRLRYGLTETNTQTIPPGRVQAVGITQPLMWRPFGWYKMEVTVAGYGVGGRSTLLPVGSRSEVMTMAAEMFPDLAVEDPEKVFDRGLSGQGEELGFSTVPHRGRLFDPLVWRRRGLLQTPTAVLIRDGRLRRSLVMIPHERIQSASLTQGPWARRRTLATLTLDIPAGPVHPRVKNQDLTFIREIFAIENRYAATARRLSDRNQWMRPEDIREIERKADAKHATGSGKVANTERSNNTGQEPDTEQATDPNQAERRLIGEQ